MISPNTQYLKGEASISDCSKDKKCLTNVKVLRKETIDQFLFVARKKERKKGSGYSQDKTISTVFTGTDSFLHKAYTKN